MTLDDWIKTALGCVLIILLCCACTAIILVTYGYFAQ